MRHCTLPRPEGVGTDWQVHILYDITLIRKGVMTDWFQHSHMKIQARLHTIGFLTNHPLKRRFVPVMKQGLPQTLLFLQLWCWHCSLWPTSCWHHLEVKGPPPQFTTCFSSFELHLFPCAMSSRPAPSHCQCTIKHDYTVKEFPGLACRKLLQSWV